ncbi:MAG: hypothetical protein QOE59_1735 [Actinomycetota bacterium]|jgi:hypothetical protein|nr:hypothetical protein [Actinomycetota bacterium]
MTPSAALRLVAASSGDRLEPGWCGGQALVGQTSDAPSGACSRAGDAIQSEGGGRRGP